MRRGGRSKYASFALRTVVSARRLRGVAILGADQRMHTPDADGCGRLYAHERLHDIVGAVHEPMWVADKCPEGGNGGIWLQAVGRIFN